MKSNFEMQDLILIELQIASFLEEKKILIIKGYTLEKIFKK